MEESTGEMMERWFREYSGEVYRFLVYYTGRADPEDLVQETFIRALHAAEETQVRNPRTWLLRIARNAAIDESRRRRLTAWLPDSLLRQVASRDRTPEEELELGEDKRALYEAIGRLRRSYRDVLVLRGIKGLSGKEAAEVLGWSESKVNVTLHRAIRALRREPEERQRKKSKEVMQDAVIR
ncbi:RNA polymerase sigma factor [Paenibacillus spiritus]|uniref:RNA polymerase sigma factor n=1 Tax=Paenibacillus spiritus TaxID=2496557 RepID=A0A5J5FWA0_9BACL|nr:RNA polymerase sigma factor [Paenibacillus spiritus]KAA8997588.1 RNA polymerase sigma factor [Paenibacillus spiritus]